ncbi:hypothetical protein ACROYT_G013943 [Oculina patagonica]
MIYDKKNDLSKSTVSTNAKIYGFNNDKAIPNAFQKDVNEAAFELAKEESDLLYNRAELKIKAEAEAPKSFIVKKKTRSRSVCNERPLEITRKTCDITKHGVRSVNSSTMTTPSEGSASASADEQVSVPSPSYGIQSNLPVPNRLDMSGNISENWKKWKQVWDSFEIASRLNEQENKYRVATFITCIGSEALEVYNGLPFEREEDKQMMSKVLELMKKHCIGQTNVIYERYCFNNRNQESGESFDAYLTALRTLAKTCNFDALTEELIRDRIVCGICNTGTRKKLLQQPKLTLQRCIDVCRSMETTASQMKVMSGKEDVNALYRKRQKDERQKRF